MGSSKNLRAVREGMELLEWQCDAWLWEVFTEPEDRPEPSYSPVRQILITFLAVSYVLGALLVGAFSAWGMVAVFVLGGLILAGAIARKIHEQQKLRRPPRITITSTGIAIAEAAYLWRHLSSAPRFSPAREGVPSYLEITLSGFLRRKVLRIPVPETLADGARGVVEHLQERVAGRAMKVADSATPRPRD